MEIENRWLLIMRLHTPDLGCSVACLSLLLLLTPLLGCGGGSSTSSGGGLGGGGQKNIPSSGEYLWETGGVTSSLAYATIDPATGALSAPITSAGPAGVDEAYPSIVVSPAHDFLYAMWIGTATLEAFQMKGPGLQLKLLSGTAYNTRLFAQASIAMHPNGKTIYAIELPASVLTIAVDPATGEMLPGAKINEDSADFREGVIDPAGHFLFVNDLSSGRIFAYQINPSDGSLTAAAGSPFTIPGGEQPSQLQIGGSGTSLFLYADLVEQAGVGGGIAAFQINPSSGALSPIPGSPFQTQWAHAPSYICVAPSGKFLYSTDLVDGSINGYTIDPGTGALALINGSPFATAATADTIAIDALGKFLYVSDYEDNTILGFSIDPASGGLTSIAGSPFVGVDQPEGMTVMNIP